MAHRDPPISGHDEAGHAKAGCHAADLGADAGADQSAAGALGFLLEHTQKKVGVTPQNKWDLHPNIFSDLQKKDMDLQPGI